MKKSQTITTPQNSEEKYNCNICRDTTWLKTTENKYVRCSCYKTNLLKKLWINFGVDPDKIQKLNNYETFDELTKVVKQKAIKYIENFDLNRNSEKNSFALLGQSGAGKSHIAIAVGATLLNRDKEPLKVVYMPYIEATKELKSNVLNEGYYNKLFSRYINADLLIIDDLFRDKLKNGNLIKINGYSVGLTEADIKQIYPILNFRYINHKPIVISSECTPEILLNLDEALARRIIVPCEGNITVFEGKKYDYKLRKFAK